LFLIEYLLTSYYDLETFSRLMENEKIMFLQLNSNFEGLHLEFLSVSSLMFEFFCFMELISLINHLLSSIFLKVILINLYCRY
jgi:hypothetical protein